MKQVLSTEYLDYFGTQLPKPGPQKGKRAFRQRRRVLVGKTESGRPYTAGVGGAMRLFIPVHAWKLEGDAERSQTQRLYRIVQEMAMTGSFLLTSKVTGAAHGHEIRIIDNECVDFIKTSRWQ